MQKGITEGGKGLTYVVPNSYPYRKRDRDMAKDRVQKEFIRLCEKYNLHDLTWNLYDNHMKHKTGKHIFDMNIEDQSCIIYVLKSLFKDENKYQKLINLVKEE